MILLSNTIGSVKESVAEVREMASARGKGGVRTEWQLSLSAKAFVSKCGLQSLMDEFFLVLYNAATLLRCN